MLTTIVGRRWAIRYRLRLAVRKCAESIELRQAFANVMFVGIAKDSWAVKDEMLLEEAIAANVSHAEKKKSVGWFAVPIWSVPPIMLDLTAS
nr:hypothetical protein [Tanacetum cinerariifolium]